MNTSQIQEHMSVVGSDGKHIGIVDRVEGNRIKLTKSDPLANEQHHFISIDMVEMIDPQMVRLNQTAQQVMQSWTTM